MVENFFIKRAGHILMLILWMESIARILILFKKDAGLLERLQKSNSPAEITAEIWKANREGGYPQMLKAFAENFPEYKDAIVLLEYYWLTRDVLSHPQMSPDGTFFCVLHDGSRNNEKKREIIKRTLGRNLDPIEALRVSVSSKDYDDMLCDFQKFDTVYFPNICKSISIDYGKIRWPYDKKN